MAQRIKGKIKSLAIDRATGKSKGFGFIESEQGVDEIFVHRSALREDDWDELREGDPVSFELTKGQKGPRAENVTIER
jgi:cold shock protein